MWHLFEIYIQIRIISEMLEFYYSIQIGVFYKLGLVGYGYSRSKSDYVLVCECMVVKLCHAMVCKFYICSLRLSSALSIHLFIYIYIQLLYIILSIGYSLADIAN